MLIKGGTPASAKAQPEIKSSACQCGAEIQFTTCPKRYCVKCSAERKLASARTAMTKQRRKRGIAQVKGIIAKCDRCPRKFVRLSIKHRFCDECAPQVVLERANRTATAKRRALGLEPLGKIHKCANCPNSFVKQSPHEFYCVECKILSSENKLPFLREAINTWKRNRYATDPAFAVNAIMRKGMSDCLSPGAKAGRPWVSLAGYDEHKLIRHIELQFLPGMYWSNRGKWDAKIRRWNIDHIRPISSFVFDGPDHPEFKAAWALSNLRPMWADENLEKRAYRTHLL